MKPIAIAIWIAQQHVVVPKQRDRAFIRTALNG